MEDLPEYPKQLPVPLREGYGLRHVSPLRRTRLASGRERQRRLFTSVPTMVTVSWLMPRLEAQLFEAWFRYTIEDGAAWFTCPLRTPLDPAGKVTWYRARFVDIYEGPDLVGVDDWRLVAELELWERHTLPKAWAEFPDFILYQDIIDRAVNEKWPAA